MSDAFILGGVRTPFGRYGGALSHLRTDDLLGQTMRTACERIGVPLDRVEEITAGCVNTAREGMGDIGRWAAPAAGFPRLGASAYHQPLLRFVSDGGDQHRSRHPQRRAGYRGRRRRRIDVARRLGSDKGRRAFQSPGPILLLDTMWAGAGGWPRSGRLAIVGDARDRFAEVC